jgi:hypothetical protein
MAVSFTVDKDPYITFLDRLINGSTYSAGRIYQGASVTLAFTDGTTAQLTQVSAQFSSNTLMIQGILNLATQKTLQSLTATVTIRYQYGSGMYTDISTSGTIDGIGRTLSAGIYLVRLRIVLTTTSASVYL